MRKILVAIAFLTIGPGIAQTASAQEQAAFPFQYAVKFICGTAPLDKFQTVARGTYFTAINVHNPFTDVSFRKKLVIEIPGQDAAIKPFTDLRLRADSALDFSCSDIASELGVVFGAGIDPTPKRRFLKGFVVFESRTELDVVAVYTTGTTGLLTQRVTTMNLERVPVRRLALADLIPAPDAKGDFCRRDESGRLIITVRNQGLADAAASTTRLEFGNGEHQLIPTPAIPAGGSVDVLAPFPAGCFRPDCTFRIAVDSTGFVSESNEGNNAAGGTCKG